MEPESQKGAIAKIHVLMGDQAKTEFAWMVAPLEKWEKETYAKVGAMELELMKMESV